MASFNLNNIFPKPAWYRGSAVPDQRLTVDATVGGVQFSTFSATATYVAGQYIYYTRTTGAQAGTSDYWKCLSATTAGQDPEDTPSKWELQELPEALSGILVWQTFGDWLTQDGQMEKAQSAYQTAELKKLNEWDRIERQMPDNFQLQVFNHVTSQNRSW